MKLSYDTVRAILDSVLGPWDQGAYDYAHEYGEPGYSTRGETPLVVLGDYWRRDGENNLTDALAKYPHIGARLESQGVEFEWHDEWEIDHDYSKAYRTSGDCYGWVPSTAWDDIGNMLTPDDDIETWIEYALALHYDGRPRAVNDRQLGGNAVAKLERAGFVRVPPDDEYAAGWHPGQTDDPQTIVAELRAEHGDDIEVIFLVTDQGQFDTHFVAMWRPDQAEVDDDE